MDSFFTIFDQALEDTRGRVLLWTLIDKRSHWIKTTRDAAKLVASKRDASDIYYGVGVYKAGITKGRGKEADVVALVALWADVDCYVEGIHKDERLPHTKEQAVSIVDASGLRPHIVIDTGNGVQALWRLAEPLLITTDKERDAAKALSLRWGDTLIAAARKLGHRYDASTHDLSRVLRCPDSFNHKRKPPLAVASLRMETSGAGYTLDQFEAVMPSSPIASAPAGRADKSSKPASEPKAATFNFIVNREATVPDTSINLISVASPDFSATWNFRRKFPSGDNSCSTYAMSVASQLSDPALGWTDQQIVDAVCHMMRRWREKIDPSYDPMKHGHQWFARMLDKARAMRRREDKPDAKAESEAAEALEFETIEREPASEQVQWLRDQLNLPIVRWEQHGKASPVYFLVLEDEAKFDMGGDPLFNQTSFRRRLAAISEGKIILDEQRPRRWMQVARMLGAITTYIDDGESEPVDQVRSWVREYWDDRNILTERAWHDAFEKGVGFIREGQIHLSVGQLAKHIQVTSDRRMTTAQLRHTLKLAGWERRTVGDGKTTRSYWVAPLDSFGCDDMLSQSKAKRKDDTEPPI